MKKSFLLLSAICGGLQCSQTFVASFQANLVADGQTYAVNVNFTEFSSSLTSNNLQCTFSDPDGNSLSFTLTPEDSSFPLQSYSLDTSTNTMEGIVFLPKGQEIFPASFTASLGFITLTSINIQNNLLQSIAGEFRMNFEEGGTGMGKFNVSQAAPSP